MLGGGLGNIAPGRASGPTTLAMACAIAGVAATGADMRTAAALDAIAGKFLDWYAEGPPNVGMQTRHVLACTGPGPGAAARMRQAAADLHARTGRTACNGSLMRTSPVALARLGDPDAIAQAATAVSALTRADPVVGDVCVLWCLAIDRARSAQLLSATLGAGGVATGVWPGSASGPPGCWRTASCPGSASCCAPRGYFTSMRRRARAGPPAGWPMCTLPALSS